MGLLWLGVFSLWLVVAGCGWSTPLPTDIPPHAPSAVHHPIHHPLVPPPSVFVFFSCRFGRFLLPCVCSWLRLRVRLAYPLVFFATVVLTFVKSVLVTALAHLCALGMCSLSSFVLPVVVRTLRARAFPLGITGLKHHGLPRALLTAPTHAREHTHSTHNRVETTR